MFKVNNKNARTTIVVPASLLLTWNIFHTFFSCFICWLWNMLTVDVWSLSFHIDVFKINFYVNKSICSQKQPSRNVRTAILSKLNCIANLSFFLGIFRDVQITQEKHPPEGVLQETCPEFLLQNPHRVFLWVLENFQNSFLIEHMRVTASDIVTPLEGKVCFL